MFAVAALWYKLKGKNGGGRYEDPHPFTKVPKKVTRKYVFVRRLLKIRDCKM